MSEQFKGHSDRPGVYPCPNCGEPFLTEAARTGHLGGTECGGDRYERDSQGRFTSTAQDI